MGMKLNRIEGAVGSARARRWSMLWGIGVAALALLACAATAARAGDDDDGASDHRSIDTKIMDGILNGIGIQTGPPIDYRERSPLVVPPKLDLPPPESAAAATKGNPAWPVDADIRRKRAIEQRAATGSVEDQMRAERRPVLPSELARGTGQQGSSGSGDPEGGRSSWSSLGVKGIFSSGYHLFGGKTDETATFTQEPQRETLIDPPPGYRTPSPDEPYGITSRRTEKKPETIADHGTGLK